MSRHASHIRQFTDELKNFIDRTHPMEDFGIRTESDQEMDKILGDVVLVSAITASLAKEVEFFMQGDISRTTFLARYKAIEKEYEAQLAAVVKRDNA